MTGIDDLIICPRCLKSMGEINIMICPHCGYSEKGDKMTGLKEKLESYKELKEFIKKYNEEEYQKGLDLGVRILTDLINEYPNQVGNAKIEWEDNFFKEDLVLKIGVPFDNNGYFFNKVKSAKDYVLKRYPDAKEHYLGIQLAKCITKRNIDKIIKEMEGDVE